MDSSLDDLIKQKKISVSKRRPAQQQPRQPRQPGKQQRPEAKRQPVLLDARDRISKLRKQQLVGQDARRRIEQLKRRDIKDARQMLAGKQQRLAGNSGPPGAAAAPAGGIILPKKVVANDLYRQKPAPPPQLEYEDDEDVRYRPSAPQQQRMRGREVPVQVARQRRDRSRSPVRYRAPAPAPPPPPPPPPPPAPQMPVIQAYKVSIANLHHGVTREDIYELFSSVGQVKKCVLLREGAAEVVYPSKEDALAAVRRYDRRELDGMPMQLRLTVVGIKVSSASAARGAGAAATAVDERALRAALFRGRVGGGSGSGGSRPVNFHVNV